MRRPVTRSVTAAMVFLLLGSWLTQSWCFCPQMGRTAVKAVAACPACQGSKVPAPRTPAGWCPVLNPAPVADAVTHFAPDVSVSFWTVSFSHPIVCSATDRRLSDSTDPRPPPTLLDLHTSLVT